MAIEPLHSSKLLMCAQRALWLYCVLVGTGMEWSGEGLRGQHQRKSKKAGAREYSEMSRLPCFAWRIKRKGTLMSASVWSFGSLRLKQPLAALVDIHITLKD